MNEKKFLAFIDKMTTSKNAALMEAVKKGFKVCCEGWYERTEDGLSYYERYRIHVKDTGYARKGEWRVILCDDDIVKQLDVMLPGFTDYVNELITREPLEHDMRESYDDDSYEFEVEDNKIKDKVKDFLAGYLLDGADDATANITAEEWKDVTGNDMPVDFATRFKDALRFMLDNMRIALKY